jgi:hypothetical protein
MNAFRSWLADVLGWTIDVLYRAECRLRGFDPDRIRVVFDEAVAYTGDHKAAKDFLLILGGEGE